MGQVLADLREQARVDEADHTLKLLQQIEALEQENARLKASKVRELSYKVTDKGGLSVYGLGRFPVTLYRGQWERLLGQKDEIVAFIETNKASLSVKD